MIRFLMDLGTHPFLIGLAVHLKWLLFIFVIWTLFGSLRFVFKIHSDQWWEMAAVIATYWIVLLRMGRKGNSHEWQFMFNPFKEPINKIVKIAKIKVF